MMGTPHKWADVIKAMADGKAVQYNDPDYGADEWWDWYSGVDTPFSRPGWEWRIKTEPKPDVVRYVNLYNYLEPMGYESKEVADERSSSWRIGMMKLTVDGETGKLKSAEVVS